MDQATLQNKISKNCKEIEALKSMPCSDVIKQILQNDLKNKRRRNDKKLHHLKKKKRITKVHKVKFVSINLYFILTKYFKYIIRHFVLIWVTNLIQLCYMYLYKVAQICSSAYYFTVLFTPALITCCK